MPAWLLHIIPFLLGMVGQQVGRKAIPALGGLAARGVGGKSLPGLGKLMTGGGGQLAGDILGFAGGFGAGTALMPQPQSDSENFQQMLNQMTLRPPPDTNDTEFLKLLQQKQMEGDLGPMLASLGIDPSNLGGVV